MANINTLYKKYSEKFEIAYNRSQKTGEEMLLPFKYEKNSFEEAYRQAKERLKQDLFYEGKYIEPSENAVIKKVIDMQKYGQVSKKQARHMQEALKKNKDIDLTLAEAKRSVMLSSGFFDLEPMNEKEAAAVEFGKEQSAYNIALQKGEIEIKGEKRKITNAAERAKIIGQVFHGSP